jgi:hypothetical protein
LDFIASGIFQQGARTLGIQGDHDIMRQRGIEMSKKSPARRISRKTRKQRKPVRLDRPDPLRAGNGKVLSSLRREDIYE